MLSAEAASAKFVKAYVCADRVVVVNTLQRSAALRAGIDESHIHVIPNWAPATGDQVERVPATHVLFAGRLVPEKGVDVLIRAAALSGVSVRIAGDGRLRSSLQRLAREQGADIDFLGWCDREKLSHELRSAAAVVVPSIWPEVFGRVTVEAFRAGVPVIGSAIGGTIDLLADDRGYLYNPFDVNQLAALLSQVVRDPAAAQARAAKARAFAASELNQERWTQRFRLVYEALGRPL